MPTGEPEAVNALMYLVPALVIVIGVAIVLAIDYVRRRR